MSFLTSSNGLLRRDVTAVVLSQDKSIYDQNDNEFQFKVLHYVFDLKGGHLPLNFRTFQAIREQNLKF